MNKTEGSPMPEPLLFKLARSPKGRGLRCDGDGLFLAGEALLERDVDDHFQPRPSDEIRKILSGVYRAETDWSSRIRSIGVVAKALNEGDLARAMMAAVLMRLPEPDGAIRISDVDGVLAKANFNPDEPRDDRGRWTSEGGAEENPTAAPLGPQVEVRDLPPIEPASTVVTGLTDIPVAINQVQATKWGKTTILFSEGLTSEQFNAFLAGRLAPNAQLTSTEGGTINNNSEVSEALSLVRPDAGGADVQASAQLDRFMEAIAPALYSYRPDSYKDAEKFITIGTDSNGNYVITSLQFLGSQGSPAASVLAGTVAIAHTHGAEREYQQPDNGDDDWIHQTDLPSFVISGRGGSTVFEIGRNNGVVSIRTITSQSDPDIFGPWEEYHDSPPDYTIYNIRTYPPRP